MTPEEIQAELIRRQLVAKQDSWKASQSAALAEPAQFAPNGVPMNASAKAELASMAKAGTLAPGSVSPAIAGMEGKNERGVGAMLYDNIFGNSQDGVDSPGEKLGRGVNDFLHASEAGLARGVVGLAGLPGTASDAFDAGMTYAGKKVGIIPEEWNAPQNTFSGSNMTAAMSDLTGGATDYKGETRASRMAGTVGEFLPGAALFGGMSPGNLTRFGVVPGVASETAGEMAKDSEYEGLARFGGALAGALIPGMAHKSIAKLISPHGGVDPERLKLVKVLDDFGVKVTAGQKVGNEAMRRKEGFTSGGAAFSEAQREAFTGAALKTAGTDALRATSDVLADTAKRIGSVFDDVTKGVDVTPSAGDLTALSGAVSTYKSLAPTSTRAPLISDVFKDVTKAFRGGNTIPAATVNTWRSNLSKLTTSGDAATRDAAQAGMDAIDDMLTAALQGAGRAADVARLATARSEWRNFRAIQQAATGAGENAAVGMLSPSALRNAVVQQGRAGFAQGRRGDIADLAKAGEGVMKQLPTSGTPEGLRALLPGGLWSASGAAAGSFMGPLGAFGGAALGAMFPAVAGAVRMSGPVQSYLGNQIMGPVSARMGQGAATASLPFMSGNQNGQPTREMIEALIRRKNQASGP